MADDVITIEFSAEDAKILHIQRLEATLTKRNKRIADLEAQLEPGAMDDEHYRRGYRDGWKQQYYSTTNAVDKAIAELKNVREKSFQNYLQGERTSFDPSYELE